MPGDLDALNLKLDRVLAGQVEIMERLDEHKGTLDAHTGALELFRQSIATQTEMLFKLAEAVSAEQQTGASDMQSLLAKINETLRQIASDASETRVVMGRLPTLLERAAIDAFRMSRGDGVGVQPGQGSE